MRKSVLIAGGAFIVGIGGALVVGSFAAEGPTPTSDSATAAAHAKMSPGPDATPRMPDGKPDFNGYWNGGRGGGGGGGSLKEDGSAQVTFLARDGDTNNFERDFAVLTRSQTNKPIYKPEHWNKIQDMDYHGLTRDPTFSCGPEGVPRMGAPDKIVQHGAEMLFLYAGGEYRIVPTDGRKHEDGQINDTTPNGYSVGRWDGDTLVVESVGFDDVTWLGWTGYVHTNEMKVTERLTRTGNSLKWIATVEDPMLQEPWTLDPQTKQLNADPKAWFWGVIPCKERDAAQIVDKHVRG
jgi:hypothetical protein